VIASLPGFFTGLSLIIAIGAQNAFVIRQGLTRRHIRWFGVLYLSWFGIRSLRSAFKVQVLDASGVQSGSAKTVVLSVLGFTFLNPHVYLDTVILLGSIGNQFGPDKWWFALGAVVSSFVWFSSIGFGAKAASRFMSKPVFWKVLDILIAIVMFSIAILLAFYSF